MPDDTVDDLCRYVRQRMPIRSRLLSPERLNELVVAAVREWPIQPLLDCERGSPQERRILQESVARVGKSYASRHGDEPECGFFWALILSSVVSALIQVMLKWWLSRPANRVKMAAWQYGMKGGS